MGVIQSQWRERSAATRGIQREINKLTMELGDDPTTSTLQIDKAVIETEQVGLTGSGDRTNTAIVSGLTHTYGTQREIPDCDATLTRKKIDRIIAQGYERLQSKQGRHQPCQLCQKSDHVAP